MPSPVTERARHLRNNMTETERRLWSRLRNRQIDGYKFRRQVPVGPYFVDFLCISARLAIEVDGPFHEDESDRRKNTRLEAEGYRVLRIPVTDIDEMLDDVVHGIYLMLTTPSPSVRLPHPAPPSAAPTSPLRGEGRARVPPRSAGRSASRSEAGWGPDSATPTT